VTEGELIDLYGYVKEFIMGHSDLPVKVSPEKIDQAFYGSIFFEAGGSHSLFYTCNN